MKKNIKMIDIIYAYPLIFSFTVALPLFGGIVGAYVGWESLSGRFDDSKKSEIVSKKIKKHDNSLSIIENKEHIVELGNNAISTGDRESYLKLIKIYGKWGTERNISSSEIARVKSHHYTMTSIRGIKLELYDNKNKLIPESDISTSQLIDNLFFNSQFLFRARSAELLASRNEKFVHEVLLMSMFSDENLEVMREANNSFQKLTGYKDIDFFNPYGCLTFWYDNQNKIRKNINKNNSITIIPFEKFKSKIYNKFLSNESQEMDYWWRTSLDFEKIIKK